MEKIYGYKAFNSDGTNMNNKTFLPGIVYHCDGKISFGPYGNGYHFALRLEDTIRYCDYDNLLRQPVIASVVGSGTIVEGEDLYNGYFDLYSASDIEIIKYLTRQEIIDYALNLDELRLMRFLSLFKLNEDEYKLFEGKSKCIDDTIAYYQKRELDTYSKKYVKKI